MHLLAQAIHRCGSSNLDSVRNAVTGIEFNAPQGQVAVDPENLHCEMRPRIGRSRLDGCFDILQAAPERVRPDPYLVWSGACEQAKTNLRVVR